MMFSASTSPKIPSLKEESNDDESIHTDSEAEDQFVKARNLLERRKAGQPVPNNADEIILKALQKTRTAGNKYKRQGRKWVDFADTAGEQAEQSLKELEQVKVQNQRLNKEKKEHQVALETLNTENTDLKQKQKLAEQAQLHAEWREKDAHSKNERLLQKITEQTQALEQLKKEVIDDAEFKALMDQMNLNPKNIDQLSVLGRGFQLHMGLNDEEMETITDEELIKRATEKGLKFPALLTEK